MSFKKYLDKLEIPGVIYTFGRFNPPMTSGHYENFLFLQKYGKKYILDPVVYTSSTQNEKKNPLNFNDKVHFLQLGMPRGVKVSNDSSLKNSFQILEDLIKKGYKRIVFVVGEDRMSDFNSMRKYAKDWSDDTVDFDIISSGGRKKGVSGTDMRNFAKIGDFEGFKNTLAKSLQKYADQIYQKTRDGLGVKGASE
jgi:nicotinic acid mononucleotide adenylyltransferase